MSEPFIDTQDVSIAYNSCPAVQGVTLTVDEGTITALVGPSGCGKTSFLSSLNRLSDLIPGCTVSGSIRIGEHLVLDPAVEVVQLRRRIGMIFQKPTSFPFSIRKNLVIALHEHGITDRSHVEGLMEEGLKAVGLWDEVKDRLGNSACALSGGQQQRLCLARALVLKPEVILLDEPCSALDPISSGVVEDLILELRGKYTMVVVTHNLAQARRIADDAAFFWVKDGVGMLVEKGPAEQVLCSPEQDLTRAYVTGHRG